MKFTHVLPGWEGTTSDSRILKNALTRDDKLIIPKGKYYLVDAGFPLRSGLLTPYRGVRYHLKNTPNVDLKMQKNYSIIGMFHFVVSKRELLVL
ncbi:hypothetical protein PTKIN_Ptkin10aG0124900 [Pterospermum kingtungense]